MVQFNSVNSYENICSVNIDKFPSLIMVDKYKFPCRIPKQSTSIRM